MLDKATVLRALSEVEDPDLKRDIVSLGMVQDILIDGKHVSFKVVLTTPACPLKDAIKQACIRAVKHFCGEDVEVEPIMTAKVMGRFTDKNSILPGVKHIILVGSGKGGVGKSTVAVNIAVGLQKSGASVGILDADIYGPSLPILLGIQGMKPKIRLENGKDKMVPIEHYGIEAMSIGLLVEPEQALAWRGPMASKAITQLITDTAWGELDYLVIDLPPGTGDIHITVAQSLPVSGAIIVTTPQKLAAADSLKAVTMFQNPQVAVPILGIVENMAYFTPTDAPNKRYHLFGKGGGELLAFHAKSMVLEQIPMTEDLAEQADEGIPIALKKGHPAANAFMSLAQKIAQQISIQQFAKS